VLDLNGDGKVSKDEMLNFLAKKNIDEDHRVQIVDELFSKCDHDGNGYVDIEEFGQEYISTKA
jgi:Ca2+-binding EF-hand superfamily protein